MQALIFEKRFPRRWFTRDPTRPSEGDRSVPGALRFPLGPVRLTAPSSKAVVHEMSEGIMSHEFDGLDATEKAGVEGALNRCRALAAQTASGLRKKRPEHFVDKFSLADLCVSLEQAADVLGQKGQRSVENAATPVVKGSQVQH